MDDVIPVGVLGSRALTVTGVIVAMTIALLKIASSTVNPVPVRSARVGGSRALRAACPA